MPHCSILKASFRSFSVGEDLECMGENRKISLRCRGNFAFIVGENRGNCACAAGETAILPWQACLTSKLIKAIMSAVEKDVKVFME